jgi:hypothetical protein
MDKLQSLRAALVAANPELDQDKDRLKIFVDEGRVISRRSKALGYEYRYTVRLFLEGFTKGPDLIMVPLLLWLRTHQPDLLLRYATEGTAADRSIQFAADILDDTSWDIAITFDLSEAVAMIPREDGSGWDCVHLPEPSPDDQLLDPSLVDVQLAEIYFGGVKILPRPSYELPD